LKSSIEKPYLEFKELALDEAENKTGFSSSHVAKKNLIARQRELEITINITKLDQLNQ